MAESGNYAGGKGHFCQLNSLWSVWYGLLATVLNVYSVLLATRRLSEYLEVVWPPKSVLPPRYEIHCFVATIGMAAVLVPLVAFTAVFRTGNMANDSDKLGNLLDVRRRRLSSCWTHGPPSSSTLHSFTALALLVVKLMIEARLIQAGLMSTNNIWNTDLDFLVLGGHQSSPPNITLKNMHIEPKTQSILVPQSLSPSTNRSYVADTDGIMSVEFFNYAMALFIYCGRYASVFWETNKCFATLFSVQLFANAIQCLSLYLFTCILYKMQVLGVCKMVKELPAGPTTYHLVLDHLDTAVLFTVTTVLIFVSNSIVYYYGYTRFNGFVKRQTGGRKTVADAYSSLMPYCASVLALLAVVASESPLLYNAIVVFRSSLNGVVLACLLNSTAHVFVWIAMWSVLTLKPCWMFDLHLFLEYDPRGGGGGSGGGSGGGGGGVEGDDAQRVPLLVVAQGATYSLTEKTAKRIVTSVVERVVADYTRVAANSDKQKYKRTPKTMSDEQIYWPRPKSSSGRSCLSEMEDSDEQSGCFGCKRTNKSTRGIPMNKVDRRGVSPEDDGDYAKLRELPMVARATNDHSDDNTSEDTKLLDTVREGVITYASANTRELFYSPATPPPPPPPLQEDISSAAEFHASKTQVSKQHQQLRDHAYRSGGVYGKTAESAAAAGQQGPQRPTGSASVTAADDFEEEDTVKSESEASAAGHSPQAACSGHSESSSGVHSNSSHDTAATMPLPPPPPPLQLSPAASTATLSPTDDEQRRRASYADLQTVDTVVIRHKGGPGAKARMPPDPCTRPTNVSLSSFTEPRGARNRPGSVPGWRTMPHNVAPPPPPQTTAGNRVKAPPSHYHQYQQQKNQQQNQINYQQHQRQWSSSYNGGGGVGGAKASAVRSGRNHSTIPTHHNGVRLFQQHQQQSYGQ
ncbi:protein tincar isoform X2 [Melanaphis sacchari]|uniref:protein tincar isoform X2 n=1 Tax=Melanaphis sacchari TaxID=742174 RepID=UPI000DC148C2|nr:protein tincar isoform X2 [Melanaphis sacchari]